MSRAERAARDSRRAAGNAFLESDADSDQAFESIVASFEESIKNTKSAEGSNFFTPTAVADRLRAQGLETWAQVTENYLRSHKPACDTSFAALQIIVGRAAGGLCGRSLDGQVADFVCELRQVFHFDTADFVSAMEIALASKHSGTGDLIEFLCERAKAAVNAPSKAAFGASRALSKLPPDASKHRRFREVWEGSFRREIAWLYDTLFYEVLRRMDSDAYLELAETYPLVDGIDALLEAADRDASCIELVSLLARALPVFDASGAWKQEHRAAFILLDLLGESLFEDGQPLADFTLDLASIIDTLAARTDALPLAYVWLQRLTSAQGRSRRPFRTNGDVDASSILASIVNAFAGRFPDLPEPIKWIEDEEEFWRKERVHALIAVEITRPSVDKTKLAALLESVLLKDLVGSFGLDRLLANQKSFESIVLGNAIAALDDPVVWFDNLWRRLFWQRDRARSHRSVDRNLPNVGQVICTWTALGLAYFPPSSELSVRLWTSLESAVRESSLMDWFRQLNDTWCLLLRFLGAIWPRIFPDDPPAGARGSLDDFLSGWLQVDANLASLVVVMRENGVLPLRLRQAGLSTELLRRIVDDSDLRGHSLLSKAESNLALDLAREIGTSEGVAELGPA